MIDIVESFECIDKLDYNSDINSEINETEINRSMKMSNQNQEQYEKKKRFARSNT